MNYGLKRTTIKKNKEIYIYYKIVSLDTHKFIKVMNIFTKK